MTEEAEFLSTVSSQALMTLYFRDTI